MYEDLRTDYMKLESPPILTEKNLFLPGHWGWAGPLGPRCLRQWENHFSLSCMADATLDLRLPPQLQGITAT